MQPKVSAEMITLPIKHRGKQFILKLSPTEYPHLVENEHFFIQQAKKAKLPVVEAQIVSDSAGKNGLLVTRFDRNKHSQYAVEDACQAANRYPADKYNLSFEESAAALIKLSASRTFSALRLAEQLLFSWLSGNGDLHAKNISVLENHFHQHDIAPAYDLPSTLFYDDQTMALTLGGRDVLNAKRYREFCSSLGLSQSAVNKIISRILAATSTLAIEIASGALPFDSKITAKVSRTLSRRHEDFIKE